MKTRDRNKALKSFRDRGGTLRTRDLMALGVHTDVLYALRQEGRIIELAAAFIVLPTRAKQSTRTSLWSQHVPPPRPSA